MALARAALREAGSSRKCPGTLRERSGTQGGSRMAFAPDGTIYMTVSGAAGRIGPRPRTVRIRGSSIRPTER